MPPPLVKPPAEPEPPRNHDGARTEAQSTDSERSRGVAPPAPKGIRDGPRPKAGVANPAAAEAGIVVVGTAPGVRPRPGVVRAAAGAETTVPGASKAIKRRACCVVGDSEAVNMAATRKAEKKARSEQKVGTTC